MNNIFAVSERAVTLTVMASYVAMFCAIGAAWFYPMYFLITLIVWQFMMYMGSGIAAHRYFSHNAFECNRFWQWFLAITMMTALFRTPAIYRLLHLVHHAKADTEDDPLVHYIRATPFVLTQKTDAIVINKVSFAKLLKRDKLYALTTEYYWLYVALGATILTTIGVLLGMTVPAAIFWMWFVPAGLTQMGTWFIVWSGHRVGYRNFDTNDLSINSFFFHFLLGGEGLHNNHHNDPRNPNNAVKWWEIDQSYFIIKMIRSKAKS
jgi:stearoyl-CoA desaturase (delta-9 desaturase)